jgi:hypothetical protein
MMRFTHSAHDQRTERAALSSPHREGPAWMYRRAFYLLTSFVA